MAIVTTPFPRSNIQEEFDIMNKRIDEAIRSDFKGYPEGTPGKLLYLMKEYAKHDNRKKGK